MSNLVSIITVNYYSEDEILGCLHSIKEFNTARIEFIVVSNSPLHSILKEQKPTINADIILHQNASNLGFAKACNIGAKLAQGDFVFFLNPDTRFLNDAIPKLLSCYQSIKKPGLIGPATLNDRNKEVPTAKNHLTKKYFISLVFPFLNRLLSSDSKTGHFKPLKTQAVPVLNGHALFFELQQFNNIGGMEEEFFMYWEENDLSLRLRKVGKQVIYCAEAKIMHKSGTSTNPYFIAMEIEKHRSQKKFILKHYPSWSLLNRISGCLAYSWRTFGSLLTFNKKKVSQFWNIFIWYCFKYK